MSWEFLDTQFSHELTGERCDKEMDDNSTGLSQRAIIRETKIMHVKQKQFFKPLGEALHIITKGY